MNFDAILSLEAKEYLRRFCEAERKGRDGQQEWDSFTVSAHKMRTPPSPDALLKWLSGQQLNGGKDMAMLVADYERVGRLFDLWHDLTRFEFLPTHLRRQNVNLLADLAGPAEPGGLPLGVHKPEGEGEALVPVSLSPEMRQINPHILSIGLSGKGKTCFLMRMIAHDIEANDRAVVVIDSDGALIDFLDNWVSSHPNCDQFIERIVIVDPTLDSGNPTFNPLAYPDDGDLHSIASMIVSAFQCAGNDSPETSSGFSAHSANLLRYAAMLLTATDMTLADLPTLLVDRDARDVLIEALERRRDDKPEYAAILDIWHQYKQLDRSSQWVDWVEPILNCVSLALADPRVKPILSSSDSTLDLKELIEQKKILFVKLPQGQLYRDADLLGSLLVSGIKRAARSLSLSDDSLRQPCALYLDEFDRFADFEMVDSITSETKKLQLGFIGTTKTLQNLPFEYRKQIVRNIGTLVAFALEREDAELLAPRLLRLDIDKIRLQSISANDQEKLQVERLTQQEAGTYFLYRVGTVAGIFNLQSPEYPFVS